MFSHLSKRGAWTAIIVGLAISFGPMLTTAGFFLSRHTALPPTTERAVELIMGPLFYLVVGAMLFGTYLAYRGLTRLTYGTEPAPRFNDRKSRLSWAGNILYGMVVSYIAMLEWHTTSDISLGFAACIVTICIVVGTIMQRRLSPGHSWTTTIIGDPSLEPKDEREQKILSEAGQMALAVSFFLLGVTVLVFQLAPKPSNYSAVFILLALASFQRGFYGMLAWKKGLR